MEIRTLTNIYVCYSTKLIEKIEIIHNCIKFGFSFKI